MDFRCSDVIRVFCVVIPGFLPFTLRAALRAFKNFPEIFVADERFGVDFVRCLFFYKNTDGYYHADGEQYQQVFCMQDAMQHCSRLMARVCIDCR